ncbi:MAG: NAD(P)-dependent oxidoreductase [Alphaproteobacteria bacterium]|nr:NAD(P)-dependent oxidoreductase [Alphaproteobacteria bacterium]
MATLITGAGMIGRETARLLRARGDDVVLADLAPPSEAAATGATIVACDILDATALRDLARRHAATRIVHTAALLSTAIRADPVRGVQVNVVGTAIVLEVARQLALRRVVLASSTSITYAVFDDHGSAPIGEDFAYRMLSQRPGSIYAATKIAGEHLGLLYADLYGLDVVALRYAAVLNAGAGPSTSVPGRLLSTLLAAGRSGEPAALDDPLLLWRGREEFVDARDCARANVLALDAPAPRRRVYSITSGETHSIDEFIAAVAAVLPQLTIGRRIEPTGGFAGFPHPRPAPSDLSAAHAELGYVPAYTLRRTVRDYAGITGPNGARDPSGAGR